MKLDVWLKSQTPPLNAEAFGRLIDVTGQAVRRYCTGERMPDAETIAKIEEATEGAVTVADLHAVRLDYLRSPAPAHMDAAS